jgi:hypothetical protein
VKSETLSDFRFNLDLFADRSAIALTKPSAKSLNRSGIILTAKMPLHPN